MTSYEELQAAVHAARELDRTTLVEVRTEIVKRVVVTGAVDDEAAIDQAVNQVDEPVLTDGWEPSDDYSNSEVVER